jgi:hypothetical protein
MDSIVQSKDIDWWIRLKTRPDYLLPIRKFFAGEDKHRFRVKRIEKYFPSKWSLNASTSSYI